jgi:hypothetical protein
MTTMQRKRDAAIAKLREDIPARLLMLAMGFVFQGRRKKAGISDDVVFAIDNPQQELDKFLKTCSMKQLKMLREIANGIVEVGNATPEELETLKSKMN